MSTMLLATYSAVHFRFVRYVLRKKSNSFGQVRLPRTARPIAFNPERGCQECSAQKP